MINSVLNLNILTLKYFNPLLGLVSNDGIMILSDFVVAMDGVCCGVLYFVSSEKIHLLRIPKCEFWNVDDSPGLELRLNEENSKGKRSWLGPGWKLA